MKVALVNPAWTFEGSAYFGCRDAHLPLELGYAKALLEAAGHEAILVDCHLEGFSHAEARDLIALFAPDMTVVPTAPSYLFWRCPPPELRVPQDLVATLRPVSGFVVAVGPHGSTVPGTVLRKLGADVVIRGECEEVVTELASTPRNGWESIRGICFERNGIVEITGGPRQARLNALPPLHWPEELVAKHRHHHHRFDGRIEGVAAEVEASRGCPFTCSFCAKVDHRDRYRRRPVATVLVEIDRLIAQGVRYVYFIDEIFMPDDALLLGLRDRGIQFGIQTRIDLWRKAQLELLAQAGCVSIEAGIESVTEEGREALDKRCRLTTEQLADLLVHAKQSGVSFVQATLLDGRLDSPDELRRWREAFIARGVWANDPVPLFTYPGSPDFVRRWGPAGDQAYERAVDDYVTRNDRMSDIQDRRPLPLWRLERPVEEDPCTTRPVAS